MASPADIVMGDSGESSTQKPFTVEENIKQLNAIDQSAVQLMSHTATALNALTTPSSSDGAPNTDPSGEAVKPSLNPPAQKEAFRSATDSFSHNAARHRCQDEAPNLCSGGGGHRQPGQPPASGAQWST
ncbi:hypothetical protein FALCPG4_014335 [Fusarium falciforme]